MTARGIRDYLLTVRIEQNSRITFKRILTVIFALNVY